MNAFESYELQYFDEMKYFCLKNCFYQNMSYLGIEHPLLHIKLGLLFKILYNSEKNTFNSYKHNLLMPLFDMGSVVYGCGDNFDNQFALNLRLLPVIVLVDVYYLPYRQEYRKYHASHSIFLTEYKASEKSVRIVDWYSPYFYKGVVMLEDFIKARNSDNPKDINPFSGFSIKNYWYKIVAENINLNLPEIINNNVNDMKMVTIDENNGIYSGVTAFEKIAIYFDTCLSKPDIALNLACKHLHDELFIFYRAVVLAKKYFEYVKLSFPDFIDLSITKFITEISELMETLNFYLLKGSVSCSKEKFSKIKTLIENICRLYYELFGTDSL